MLLAGLLHARKLVPGSNIACLPSKNVIHSAKVAESDEILGLAAFATGAGEMMAIVQTAMMGKLPCTALRDAILAHPTMVGGLVFLIPVRRRSSLSNERSAAFRAGRLESGVVVARVPHPHGALFSRQAPGSGKRYACSCVFRYRSAWVRVHRS